MSEKKIVKKVSSYFDTMTADELIKEFGFDWVYNYDTLISIPESIDERISHYEKMAKENNDGTDKEKFLIEYLKKCKIYIQKILKDDIEHQKRLPLIKCDKVINDKNRISRSGM